MPPPLSPAFFLSWFSFLFPFFLLVFVGFVKPLRVSPLGRLLPAPPGPRDSPPLRVHVRFVSHLCQKIPLGRILSEALERTVQVCYILEPTIGSWLYKPSDVFTGFEAESLDSSLCYCDGLGHHKDLSKYGVPSFHTCCLDVEVASSFDEALPQLLDHGLNHVPPTNDDINLFLASVQEAWYTSYIPDDQKIKWVHVEPLLKAYCAEAPMSYHGLSSSTLKRLRGAASCMTRSLYTVGLDKAKHNPFFICIKAARLIARERLRSDEFILTNESVSQALFRLEHELLTMNLPKGPLQLPFLFFNYKQHKDKFRFLSNAGNCIFSPVACLITTMLVALKNELKLVAVDLQKSCHNFLNVHCNPYWPVGDPREVALNLPNVVNSIESGDISRCFETIPHSGTHSLEEALLFCTRKVQHRCHTDVVFWVKSDRRNGFVEARVCSRCPGSPSCWHAFSFEQFIMINSWLLNNSLLQFGQDQVHRQLLGIFMGHPCSPEWCDVYLLSFELRAHFRWARLCSTSMLASFRHSFRYIDDIISFNAPPRVFWLSKGSPEEEDNPFWIYPLSVLSFENQVTAWLPNSAPFPKGCSVNFLEYSFSIGASGRLAFCHFDKKDTLPFVAVRYMHFKSNRPRSQLLGFIPARILTFLFTNSAPHFAVAAINKMVLHCVARDFPRKLVDNVVMASLQRFLEVPGTSVSVPRVIQRLANSR